MSVYYVEPDYWVSGYTVDDGTGSLVFSSSVISATATVQAGANYTVAQTGVKITATATVVIGPSFIQTLPGINLNAKSNALAVGNITSKSNGGLSLTTSDVRMTGRPFWELTSPASGTWTTIVPQAEGTGK